MLRATLLTGQAGGWSLTRKRTGRLAHTFTEKYLLRRGAEHSMDHLLKDLDARSSIQPLATLAKTLRKWRVEILNHFDSKLTNAMTEGFNNKIKLIKRMAYGFRNPEAYDLRILYACYH